MQAIAANDFTMARNILFPFFMSISLALTFVCGPYLQLKLGYKIYYPKKGESFLG
jgi:hypothetical protein